MIVNKFDLITLARRQSEIYVLFLLIHGHSDTWFPKKNNRLMCWRSSILNICGNTLKKIKD